MDREARLIVVTGRPASGKTTLARQLALRLSCPLIARDEIKAGYVLSGADRGTQADPTALHVYTAFFDAVECMLARDISLVTEAAFQHHLWEPKLSRIAMEACVRIILCSVPARVALSRMSSRMASDPDRLLYHHGDAVLTQEEQGYTPPHLSVPTLIVDTRNGYNPGIDSIVAFSREA